MFAPLGAAEGGVDYIYLYLGPLEDSAWFHTPDVERDDD